MVLRVTAHAIERAMERIPGIESEAQAREVLERPVIHFAADLAGDADCFVRLTTGERICIRDHTVLTVYPAEHYRRNVRRLGRKR